MFPFVYDGADSKVLAFGNETDRQSLNNAIQELIKKAFWYRNRERFKADIFLHLGGSDLYRVQ